MECAAVRAGWDAGLAFEQGPQVCGGTQSGSSGQTFGDAIRRMTFHYWFHIGEILAIRQMLGQKRLPEYVGNNLEAMSPYRPEK